MGVMILVLTPCLYCNVSDSWMLPNKWHRAAIGAAGMYVELVIASICTFIWWFSEPGMLNHLCLSTMFVCSVSTLMFNSNPLLRYDGYYILSDVIEIPNLRQKATDILGRKLGDWCLGLEQPDDPFLPERNQFLFALYSVAAAIYRWVVVFSILWFLYEIWKPYRLEIIGQIIGLASIYGLAIQPLWKVGKFFYVPGRIEKVKKPRMYATLAVLATVAAALLFIPLPHRVYCTLEIQPHAAKSVYVSVPGELEQVLVKPGAKVKKRTPVAKLRNFDLLLAVADLEGQRAENRTELDGLHRRSRIDEEASAQIPAVEAVLKSIEEQLVEKKADLERLNLIAPADGTLMPPPEQPDKPDDKRLSNWSGTPLEPRNQGAYLQEGVMFCQVGDPTEMEALMVVDQDDVEYLAAKQVVDVKLDELPTDTLTGEIAEIAKEPLRVSPRHISNKAGGELATKTDEAGVERPMSTSYQVRVPLKDPEGLLRIGLRGRGRVHALPQTLAHRLWRYVTQTFHFRL
jgi:putative peptide zinc metalloprotease protein